MNNLLRFLSVRQNDSTFLYNRKVIEIFDCSLRIASVTSKNYYINSFLLFKNNYIRKWSEASHMKISNLWLLDFHFFIWHIFKKMVKNCWLFMSQMVLYFLSSLICTSGGTGRRTGLKILRPMRAYRFDSGLVHQRYHGFEYFIVVVLFL